MSSLVASLVQVDRRTCRSAGGTCRFAQGHIPIFILLCPWFARAREMVAQLYSIMVDVQSY
jgi:hypothetical protein